MYVIIDWKKKKKFCLTEDITALFRTMTEVEGYSLQTSLYQPWTLKPF